MSVKLATRGAAFAPSTFNAEARTIDLRWTTGAEVRRESWFDGPFIERLETGAGNVRLERLNNGASLLDSHQGGGLSNVLGVVERAWMQDGEGWATVRFSGRDDVAPILQDVRDGIIRNVSVGYQIHATVTEQRNGMTLIRATDWEPFELSLVPIPADPGAQTRELPIDEMPTPDQRAMTTNPQAGAPAETVTQAPKTQEPAPAPTAEPVAAVRSVPVDDVAKLQRQAEIAKMAARSGYPADRLEALLDMPNVTDAAVEVARWAGERAQAQVIPAGHPVPNAGHLVVTRAEGATLMHRLGEALQYRIKPVGAPSDAAREFRAASLLDMARACVERAGVATLGMSKRELVSRAFHVSSDFADLFTSTAERNLLSGYEEEPHQWSEFCYRQDFSDFRETKGVILSAALAPSALLEGGEYKAGTMRTDTLTAQLGTYGRKVNISREMIINDDLSALSMVPEKLGRGCRLLEHNMVAALITGNAAASIDGTALYDASHNNTSDVAIGTPAVAKAVELMRKQTDPAGERINLEPAFILCSAAQELAVTQLMNPLGYAPAAAAGSAGPNIYAGRYRVIVDPRLDAVDPDLLHFIASPTRIPTIRYGFLEGESGPSIESIETRDPDGLTLLCRHDFGVSLSDFRGFVRINLSA